MANHSQKQIIREKVAKLKNSLSGEAIIRCSELICNRLVSTDLFNQSTCIALYYALGDEVLTSRLIDEWRFKKQIVLPVVAGKDLHFYPYTGNENLKKSDYGIMEPVGSELITPESIDIYIIPGIAFDYNCNRLGRGKGYYDRYLSGIEKPLIGLCFDFQLVERIPADIHDKKMTMVITEKATVFLPDI